MTTIAYRDGVMAADSRLTLGSTAAGSRVHQCEKLYRKFKGRSQAIIGLCGESSPGLVFLDWYGTNGTPPASLVSNGDFYALVLDRTGLYLYDEWCRGEKVLDSFFAIGSGSKAALGAMHAGADARRAVQIACRIDPYSAPPIVTMRLR